MAPLRGMAPSDGWKAWQVALMVGVPVSVVGGVYLYRRYQKNPHPSIPSAPPKPEDEAKKFKTQGNEHFKAGRYPSAIDCYSKAIELGDNVGKDELSTFYQNRAAAYDQLQNYLMVVKDCTQAISLNPRYVKALSRRARAYHTTGFLNEALEDITAACVLEGFSVGKNVQLADVIIKEVCNKKADAKLKVRVPKEPSGSQVTRFLASFSRDPVFNTPEYNSLSKASTLTNANHFNRSSYKRALLSFMNEDYSNVVELCDEEINKSRNNNDDGNGNGNNENGNGEINNNENGNNDGLNNTVNGNNDGGLNITESHQDNDDEGFTSNKVYRNKENSDSGLVEGAMAVNTSNGDDGGGGGGGNDGGDGGGRVNGDGGGVVNGDGGVVEGKDGGGGETRLNGVVSGDNEDEDDGIDIKEGEEGDLNHDTIIYSPDSSLSDLASTITPTSELPTSSATSTTTTTPTASTTTPTTLDATTPSASTTTTIPTASTTTPTASTTTPATSATTTTPATSTATATRSYAHEAQSLKGTYLLLAGNNTKAIETFTSLIQDDTVPNKLKSNSLLKRAKVFSCEDRMPQALQDYATAAQLDPCNPDVFMHRGQFHLVNERLEEAVKDFDRCLELEQSNPEPFIHKTFTESRRALLAGNIAALSDLLKDFKDIITRFPHYAEAHVFYGQALQDMQKFDEADESYQKAAKLDATCSNAYVHRGVLRITWRNDLEGGLELLRKAVQVDACNAFAYQALGTILFQKGDIEAAVENVDKAIQNVSSKSEMAHLFTILEAAQVQTKVASKLGVNLSPPF